MVEGKACDLDAARTDADRPTLRPDLRPGMACEHKWDDSPDTLRSLIQVKLGRREGTAPKRRSVHTI